MATTSTDYGDIVFVIGPPGCGKTTACKNFVHEFKSPSGQYYLHLSIEHDLRTLPEGDNITAYAEVRACPVQDIELLPPNILLPLIEQRMKSMLDKLGPKIDKRCVTFFIDGFPLTHEAARAFDQKFGKPKKVIVMHCLRGIAIDRYLRAERDGTDDEVTFRGRWWRYRNDIVNIRRHYSAIVQSILMNGTRAECLDEMIRYRPRYRGEPQV